MKFTGHKAAVIALIATVLSGCVSGEGDHAEGAAGGGNSVEGQVLDIDYAPYNPLSLIIGKQGWLESQGVKVKNGSPIKVIAIYSQPEWAALVAPKGSSITSVEQLRGKNVAATKGTDPYFFLLQALEANGLSAKDVTVQNLQHADGWAAHGQIAKGHFA
jgi:sulfonate transport system substrate-binding protein